MTYRSDEGFGLTEVIVSMFLLLIVFLAFGALIIQALTTVATNGTRASAAQLATERIEEVRLFGATSGLCTTVADLIEDVAVHTDGRGVQLRVSGEVEPGTCVQTGAGAAEQRSQPMLARVSVFVEADSPEVTNPIAEVTTDLWVSYQP